jgi:hypothetical protein
MPDLRGAAEREGEQGPDLDGASGEMHGSPRSAWSLVRCVATPRALDDPQIRPPRGRWVGISIQNTRLDAGYR